jgi:hypothetical protein
MQLTDHIQIVNFRLAGLKPEEYAAHCEAVAPQFARIPGLRSKAWLADERTNCFGGLYTWESREAMEAYVQGPIFGALRANPQIGGLMTRDWSLLPEPTRITQPRQQFSLAPRDAWAA